MRLNRFLSASGFVSRRKGEDIIRSGRVRVNGQVVADPAADVSPEDFVAIDGRPIVIAEERQYFLMNKPEGVIVTLRDSRGRPTVLDLLGPETGRVFPVGRLDANTTGALLLTDDGDLAFRLTHPSFGIKKVYRAVVRGKVAIEDTHKVAEGIELDDGPTAPALMRILSAGARLSTVELTLHEGRKRQVRRMMDRLAHPVVSLERVSFAGLTVAGISPGSYRPLTPREVQHLKRETAYPSPAPPCG